MKQIIFSVLALFYSSLVFSQAQPTKEEVLFTESTVTWLKDCDTCTTTCCEKTAVITTKTVVKYYYDTCNVPVKRALEVPKEFEYPSTPLEPQFDIVAAFTAPTVDCNFTAETWVNKYGKDCDKAPSGRYQIQFHFSKLNFLQYRNPSFKYITEEVNGCGYRFLVSKIFNNYCDAMEYLNKYVIKDFPSALIKRIY